jgi:PAS domain S-box-containing protein
MAKGGPFDVEERELNNTGEHRPPRGAPVRDKNGPDTKRYGAEETIYRSEKDLGDIIEAIPAAAWTALSDGSNVFSNRRWADYTGLSAKDTAGSGWQVAVHPEDVEQYLLKWRSSVASGEPFEAEARFRRASDGEYRWFLVRAAPLRDDQGSILRWYGILTDIEDRKRAEALLAGEKRILEMVAQGDSLPRIADSLCRLVEEHTRDALTSILLIEDGRLRHVGKPNLPRAYVEAVDGSAIGPTVGSCGTAAYFGKKVIVSDIASDPWRADYCDLALQHSIRAVWSTPIMCSEGKVIGTFAMYYREPRSPSPRDQAIVEQITHLAGVAIQRTRLHGDLAEREAKIRRLVEANIIGILFWEGEGQILEANDAFLRLVGYDHNDLVAGRLHRNNLTPPEWGDRTAPAWAAVKSGVIQQYEKEYFRKDGSRVPVLIAAATFEASGNEGVAFVLDLTERRRAEEALRESEERFRTLVQFSFDVYWESNAQHRFTRQEFAESVVDAPAPGFEIGKTRWEVPYLEPDAEAWRRHRETLDAHMPFRDFELARPMPNGGKRYVSVSGLPVFDRTGRFIGYRGVGRHITRRKLAEEERRYEIQLLKTVTDNASSMLYIVDAAGLGTFVNPAFERITGYRAEEVIGQVVHDKIHHTKPDGTPYPVHECPLTGAVHQRRVLHGEDLFVRKDGTFFPVGYTASPIFRDGVAVGALIEVQDLTETRAAEAELRSQAQLLSLAHDAIIVRDPEGRITFWNEGAVKTYGWTAEQAIGRVGHELLQTRFPVSRRAVEIALREHGEWEGELTHITRQGSAIFVTCRQSLQPDEHGAARAILEISRDITERKQAEQELRASEARFRTFVDHATDAFMLHSEDGTILDVNRHACDSLGYSRDELIGMTPIDFDPDVRRRGGILALRDGHPKAPRLQNFYERLDAGEIMTFESRHRRKDGTVFPVEVRVREFRQGGRRLRISLTRDITERKRAEEALRESEEQWRAVFENNPTMYLMADVAGTIVSVNPFGAEQLGYRADELIGRRVQDLFHEVDREAVRRNTAICLGQPGRAISWELRKIRKDGEVLWVRETARAMLFNKRPVVLIACEDITDGRRAAETLREVQMELAHANRLATMGQLTASIAHEVKQPIGATVTNAQAALRFLGDPTVDLDEVREILNDIVKDGNRASEVISRIRGLIKKEPPRRDLWEINGAIREVIELTRGEAVKNGVSVRAELANGLPLVQGDKVQLQQVILNLIVNAIEAISDVDEEARELLISSGTIVSGGVLVTVRDSGPGLAPAALDRVFESFYTTKSSGLGMGLSICRSIVEAHGGRLWASANDPRGAVFQFTVPAEGI